MPTSRFRDPPKRRTDQWLHQERIRLESARQTVESTRGMMHELRNMLDHIEIMPIDVPTRIRGRIN